MDIFDDVLNLKIRIERVAAEEEELLLQAQKMKEQNRKGRFNELTARAKKMGERKKELNEMLETLINEEKIIIPTKYAILIGLKKKTKVEAMKDFVTELKKVNPHILEAKITKNNNQFIKNKK